MPQNEETTQGAPEVVTVNLDEALEKMSPEELKTFAKEKATEVVKTTEEFTKYRSESEKGAKKLLEKQKETELSKEDVGALVDAKVQQQFVDLTVDTVKQQLSEEERQSFETEFKDLTEGKTVTKENINTYIEKTLKLISKEASIPSVVGMPAGAGKATSATKQEQLERRKAAAKELVKKFM